MSTVSSSSSGLMPLLAFRKEEAIDLTLPWRDVENRRMNKQHQDVLMDINTNTLIAPSTRQEIKIDTSSSSTAAVIHNHNYPSKYPGVTPGRHLRPAKVTTKNKIKHQETVREKEDEEAESQSFFFGLLPLCKHFEDYSKTVRTEGRELTSQLDVLVDKAKRERLNPQRGLTWNGPCLRVLLQMAFLMKANLDSMFAAIEVFDRFTIEFSDLIQPVILDLERNNDTAGLKETKERIQAQVPLRMASCIHLCLKLHADLATAGLTLDNIKNILASLSFSYSKSAIAKSEIRVFSTLNFRLSFPNAWEMATTLLACIPDLNSAVRATITQQTASLLFMAYENHSSLVEALWNIHITSNRTLPSAWKDPDDPKVRSCPLLRQERQYWRDIIYGDFSVILGGGAVAAAFTILSNCPSSPGRNPLPFFQQKREITKEISRFLRTPQMRVSDMSIAILQITITCTVPESKPT